MQPVDLETPTIKQNHYTTGRGGQGNIVSNDNPDNARKAQDVGPPESAFKKSDDHGGFHGRGGAANVIKKIKEVIPGAGKEEEGKGKEKEKR